MSSSPDAESDASGGGNGAARKADAAHQPAALKNTIGRIYRRPWSLRAHLVATQIFLLAVVSLIIGVSTQIALRSYLVAQSDHQLIDAVYRAKHLPPQGISSGNSAGLPPPHTLWGNGGLDFLRAFGQSAGTLGARIDSAGHVTSAGYIDGRSPFPHPVTTGYSVFTSLPPDGRPTTRSLGPPLGDYRMVATSTSDGDVIVIGLPLRGVEDTLFATTVTLSVVTFGGLLIAGLAGTFIVRRTLRPLGRVAETAAKVTEIPLHQGDVALQVRVPQPDADPRTEVGQVGAALNHMLGHVGDALGARQASEMRVRQFVADASHELRTPLAAIRGYAELSRRSQDRLPPEISHALRRIESESIRMTALVEDLLLLARLDSGRPLDLEPLDLTRLVVDAVSDAHIAGPHHNWRIDVPDEPITVTGDAQRLHQVVANLLANARNHTQPGTTVVTGISVTDSSCATLFVVDDGPGISPELLPKVFDRFARGDTSRSRQAGSTGLGLSIVSAVVNAQHGSVSVASRPGRTEFAVRLPLAQSPGKRSH